ncbi:MAG: biotin transporter BioY [Bacilli bacterium]|nr:biotin transporter BioY [Bacilli bacterium]
MDKVSLIKRMSKNAILLAMLCVIGMFSVPLGDYIKVSLQLLMVFIIGLTVTSFIDGLIITGLYLLLGLFLPIYAGFNAGISPTFGFVISFVVIIIPLYFLNKLKIKNQFIRMGIACFVSLLICYTIGSIFLMLYLNLSIEKALLVSVVPYIPFDIAKVVIATLVVSLLPKKYR